MKTLFRLLTLYMTVPVVELFFLWQVNELFGYWTGGYGWILTGALIIGTAVAGSYLAKREGLSAWNRLQGSFGEGGLPGDEILDAVIILIAGVLLITPGVLTDFVGFTGLIPLTRGWIRRFAKRRLKKAMREGRLQAHFGGFGPGGGMSAPPDGGSDFPGPGGPFGAGDGDGPRVGGTPAEHGPKPQPSSKNDSPDDSGKYAPPSQHAGVTRSSGKAGGNGASRERGDATPPAFPPPPPERVAPPASQPRSASKEGSLSERERAEGNARGGGSARNS